jgi:hypothetical protein
MSVQQTETGSALAKSKKRRTFDPKLFLKTVDGGRTLNELPEE